MDDRRFDELARAWSGGASRRTIVKTLSASVVGGLAALLGSSVAAAGCRAVGRRCREADQCCTKLCGYSSRHAVCTTACTDETDCPRGQTCCCGGPVPCFNDRGFCTDDCPLL